MNVILSQQYVDVTSLLKVLTHPGRIAILELLRDGEHCVCHLEAHLGLRQAYLSQQLAVLRAAGLIQDRREGWNIYYRVVNSEVFSILDAANKFIGPDEVVPVIKEVNCPCPQCNSQTE